MLESCLGCRCVSWDASVGSDSPCIVVGRSDGDSTLVVTTGACGAVAISESAAWPGPDLDSSVWEVRAGVGSTNGVIDKGGSPPNKLGGAISLSFGCSSRGRE